MHPTGKPHCCRSMTSDCPMPDAGISPSCCLIYGSDTVAAPAHSYFTLQPQQLFFPEHAADYVAPAASNFATRLAFNATPPDPSPGGSILRI